MYTQENKYARVLFVKGGASVVGDPLLVLSVLQTRVKEVLTSGDRKGLGDPL